MTQYMVIETFLPGSKAKIYERFHAKGRMLPDGLIYINSWLEKDGDRCFQLMETDNVSLFDAWIENWKDLTAFEIVEIGEKPKKVTSDATLNKDVIPDEVLLTFAKSIYVKCRALDELKLEQTEERTLLRQAIFTDIKKCSNLLPRAVSRKALKEAEKIQIDLYKNNWHDQHKFDPGRSLFHFEHCVPISAIVKECQVQHSEEAILSLLKHKLCVAWILKSEDKELTRLGYKTKRPDPSIAYKQAGIELIYRKCADEQKGDPD